MLVVLSAIIRFLSFLSLTSTGMFQLAGTLKYRYGRASNSIIKEEKSEESSPDKRTAPPSPLHFRFYLLIWSKGYTGKQTFSHLLLHGWWKGRNGAICVIPDEGPFHGSHSCTNLVRLFKVWLSSSRQLSNPLLHQSWFGVGYTSHISKLLCFRTKLRQKYHYEVLCYNIESWVQVLLKTKILFISWQSKKQKNKKQKGLSFLFLSDFFILSNGACVVWVTTTEN